jgi:hypothetical protein
MQAKKAKQAKTHTVEDFKVDLRREVEAICKKEGFTYDKELERGYAFQRWCSELLSHHDGLEEDDAIDHFTSNDLKIDFIAEDMDEKALYLGQSKFVSLAASPPLDESEVNDFFSRHELFMSGKWVAKNANETLMEYVSDYKHRVDNNWSLHFYFFSTGRASDRISDLVLEKETNIQNDYPGVKFHLLDLYGLKEFAIEAQTLDAPISENVSLQFQEDRAFIMNKPRKTLVGTIQANTIVNLYRKERERIFTYNIRSFLGRKGVKQGNHENCSRSS